MKRAWLAGIVFGCHAVTTISNAAPLVPSLDDVGFSLDDDWQESWRRILDRSGRPSSTGPIQQRFSGDHRPETEEALAVSDYPLADEWKWARSEGGARWWVHSYDALRLGTHVQLKCGAPIDDAWRVKMRFDRLDTPSTESDFVHGEFEWSPGGTRGPYASIGFFPRIEKQDNDFAVTVGHRGHGVDGRLKLYALDVFSNGSYALAKSTDFDADDRYVTKQLSLPLAAAFEISGVRLGNWRFEGYLGGVLPQRRELYTEGLQRAREQEESGWLLGALAEYRVPSTPLWAGVSGTAFVTRWREEALTEPAPTLRVLERTYQGRAYALAVLDPNLRLETQLRYMSRPERRSGFSTLGTTRRRDSEWIYHTRLEWLISRRAGLDLSYWRTFREALGPPDANVTGRALRVDVRALLRFERFLATFGVGANPLPGDRPVYAGGGGNMVLLFD